MAAKIQEWRRDYGLKEVAFVGDRGMVTQANAEPLKQVEGLHTITALTHRQIVELVERKVIQAELFDEKRIAEVINPEQPGQRYCLCRNPQTQARPIPPEYRVYAEQSGRFDLLCLSGRAPNSPQTARRRRGRSQS